MTLAIALLPPGRVSKPGRLRRAGNGTAVAALSESDSVVTLLNGGADILHTAEFHDRALRGLTGGNGQDGRHQCVAVDVVELIPWPGELPSST